MKVLSLSTSMLRFINARRRILQPMLDSSCSETPKTKKKTAQNRPVQRFWPDSIASGATQPPPNELAMSEGMGAQGTPVTPQSGWQTVSTGTSFELREHEPRFVQLSICASET